MENQYVNSKLFGELLEIGGQGLVGTYVMLLKGRNGYHRYNPILNSNGKTTKGKRLISKQSGVSLSALNVHLPKLLELGLCSFMNDGGFILKGSKKISEQYKSRKKIPVRIGKNLRETKGNINAVLIIANLYRQTKQIDKKVTLNKAKRRADKNLPISANDSKLLLNYSKNNDIENLNKVENTILSNKGFSKLIRGCKSDANPNMVSHGGYWKKVLEKRGFIASRRRYKTLWSEKISYSQFLSMRSYFKEQYGFVTYRNNRVVKPIASEIAVINTPISSYTTIYNTSILLNKINLGVEGTPPAIS